MASSRQDARGEKNEKTGEPPLDIGAAALDTLLKHLPVGTAFFDSSLRCVRVNEALANTGGLLGTLEPLVRQVSTEGGSFEGVAIDAPSPTGSGLARHWLASLYPIPNSDPGESAKGVLAIVSEVTDRRRAEEERDQTQATLREMEEGAQNHSLVLETANRVALDILSNRTGIEALSHIAEAARTLAGAQYAALGVARPDGPGLQEFITVGLTPEQEAAIGPRPRGLGVLGLLLTRKEPLRIDVLAEHPLSAGFPPNHPPMDSFLGVPIRRDDSDTVLGSLYLTNKTNSQPFTEADEAAVEALGAYAAVAIHNLEMLRRQRALLSGILNAQEEERRSVAYDLHDGLTQYVMAAHAHLESFRRAHQSGREERANQEMDQGLKYLKEAVLESRRLVNGLRALALDDLGLAGALEQLLAEEKARAGWTETDFVHNVAARRFDRVLETAVYRVAQEALTNTRKHAQSDRVRLVLLAEPDPRTGSPELSIEIRDWGKGFVPANPAQGYNHFGLHGMFERVSLMGGTHELQAAPGSGTIVRAVFPIMEPYANAEVEKQK